MDNCSELRLLLVLCSSPRPLCIMAEYHLKFRIEHTDGANAEKERNT
jgi:hypothetical protein